MSVPFALIVMAGGVAGFVWWQYQTDDRINANQAAIQNAEDAIQQAKNAAAQARKVALEVERERIEREEAISLALDAQCRENEAQDAALVLVLQGAIRERRQLPPNEARSEFIEVLRDAIRDREPAKETDCRLP
jgi:type II secretory pathway pseudopilin PulG